MTGPTVMLLAPFAEDLDVVTSNGDDTFAVVDGAPAIRYRGWGYGAWGYNGAWGYFHPGFLWLQGDDEVSLDPDGAIGSARGSIEVEFFRDVAATAVTFLDCGDGTSGKDRLRLRISASDRFEMVWTSNGGTDRVLTCPTPILADTTYRLYAGWDGVYVHLSVNHGVRTEGLRDVPTNDWGTAGLALKAA